MKQYKIHYKGDNGSEGTEIILADSELSAQDYFYKVWSGDNIIGIDEMYHDFSKEQYEILRHLLQLLKTSGNNSESSIGTYAKPIAAISAIVIDEYKRHLDNHNLDSPGIIAKRIYNLIISK